MNLWTLLLAAAFLVVAYRYVASHEALVREVRRQRVAAGVAPEPAPESPGAGIDALVRVLRQAAQASQRL
jgi:hypothetical protein